MKLVFMLFTLLACSAPENETFVSRETTKTIYYKITGKPVELAQEVQMAFAAKVKQNTCWRMSDWQMADQDILCVEFMPHTSDIKLNWAKDRVNRDYILSINVARSSNQLRYSFKFDCFDGEKIHGCLNPGGFKMDRPSANEGQAIVDRLFHTPLILGVK